MDSSNLSESSVSFKRKAKAIPKKYNPFSEGSHFEYKYKSKPTGIELDEVEPGNESPLSEQDKSQIKLGIETRGDLSKLTYPEISSEEKDSDIHKENLKRLSKQPLTIFLNEEERTRVVLVKNTLNNTLVETIDSWLNSPTWVEDYAIPVMILSRFNSDKAYRVKVEPFRLVKTTITKDIDPRLLTTYPEYDMNNPQGYIEAIKRLYREEPEIKQLIDEILKYQPYKLFIFEIKRLKERDLELSDSGELNNAEKILKSLRIRLLYNLKSTAYIPNVPIANIPHIEESTRQFEFIEQFIPSHVYQAILTKVLLDECITGLPKAGESHLVLCDLFRNKPAHAEGGYHNDSGYYPDVHFLRTALSENISYVSLTMFLSNRESIDHSTALIVDPLRGPSLLGDLPTSVKFPIITGSQILFSNVTFLHATPEREILRSDKSGDSLSTEIGKKVYYGKIANITSKSLPQSVVEELTQTSQRSFLRVQYSTRPIEDYTATSSFFPIYDRMISEILLYLGDGNMLDLDTTHLVESKKEIV